MGITVKDALKSDVTYPLGDVFIEKTLIRRGLNGVDSFSKEIGESMPYRLAFADCLVRHITAVNISDAELSFSQVQEIDRLLRIANGIYKRYGEEEVQSDDTPTATYIGEDWIDS